MLDERIEKDLCGIFKTYPAITKVVLFGSRARGDYKYNSDIDLCIFSEGISHLDFSKMSLDIEDIKTALSFDLIEFEKLIKAELINNILNEGVVIYER